MYNPTRDQVRQFFADTWAKYRSNAPLAGLEATALDLILLHPEYHALLGAGEEALARDYTPESGEANPFLHLSLHLAIEEQLSIDQPPGIAAEFARILAARRDRHEALHAVLECLGETVWRAQREGGQPDAQAYLECLRRS
jgi:hypothetical protein